MTTSLEPATPRKAETSRPIVGGEGSCTAAGHAAIEAERLHAELDGLRTKVANLQVALHTSRRIGMAMGIVMARRKVGVDDAFELLRTASQRRHCKLRDIAEQVLYTGDVDGV